MSGLLVLPGALVPDPPYMIVPVFSTLGGLVNAVRMSRGGEQPDWARAWVTGNVGGSAFGVLALLFLTFLEVT